MNWPLNKRFIRDACKHFPGGIPAGEELAHVENCDAGIMLIGEAGGASENKRGLPFVGAAGKVLDILLDEAGLSRRDCYITNVVPYQPPNGNKFESIPREGLERAMAFLAAKAAAFAGRVIVPLGNNPLSALTDKRGILKWRGSPLPFHGVNNSVNTYLLATIHPAALLRQPLFWKTSRFDFARIAAILRGSFREEPYKLICTTWNDGRLRSLEATARSTGILACDIETVRGTGRILCISFCADGRVSYSVDCRKGIPPIVHDLLGVDVPKAFTNGSFDCYILRLNGVRVADFYYDTALLFHALDNNAGPVTSASSEHGKSIIRPYSLAYGASVFTDLSYWKDSGKDTGKGEHASSAQRNWTQFSEYNAKDSLGTWRLTSALKERLSANKRVSFYKSQYATLIEPLLGLSLWGVRFDVDSAARATERLSGHLVELRDKLEAIAGRPMRTVKVFKKEPKAKADRKDKLIINQRVDGTWIGERKSLSNIILQNYLYKKAPIGLGLRRQTKDGHTTSDEIAIRKLQLFVAGHADDARKGAKQRWKGDVAQTGAFLQAVLDYRECEKTLQFINSKAVDADGRIRSYYGQAVQSGRLKSAGNPAGTGYNLQNIQRDVRHFFVPDTALDLNLDDDNEPIYLVELDLKQAEDLIVKAISHAITKDARPLERIRAVQNGTIDIHSALAASIFGCAPAEVTKEQRYVTKRCRHGINNGMRFRRMGDTLLKDGYPMPLPEIKRIFRAINEVEPWVDAFHQACRRTVMRYGGVATSRGWQLDLRTEMAEWTSAHQKEEAYKRAYTFVEQSEVGVLMKQDGLLNYWHNVRPFYKARLNMLVHDNVVLSVPRSELYAVLSIMYDGMVKERDYGIYHPSWCDCGSCDLVPTCRIAIPAEIKIATRLACTCATCKTAKKPLELGFLPDGKTFWKLIKEWEKKQ